MGWAERFRRKNKTEKVLIVVLCGDQKAHMSLVHLATEVAWFSAQRDHRFTVELMPISFSPQELARNAACALALEKLTSPDDTLVMVDNDMIQQGWRSLRIIETKDYDIAGGLQYMWYPRDLGIKREPHAWPCVFMKKPDGQVGMTAVYPAQGEAQREVDRVGSGFMAVKRRVIADERMLLAPGFNPPALWRNVYQPNYERTKGLDMDFCDRAKALGYRVVVNWQAQIGHNKSVNINEIDEYAKAQAIAGFEAGVSHALQVVEGRSGSPEVAGGSAGPGRGSDPGVGVVGLDRAAGSAGA